MDTTDWKKLIQMCSFFPVSELSLSASSEECAKQLMKVNDNQYLSITPFNSLTDASEKCGGPFIAGFYWVSSDAAMDRVYDSNVEGDEDNPVTIEPPMELLLGAGSSRYSDILGACKKQSDEVMESASYRIAVDGKFVCKRLTVGGITFFFRNHDDDKDDRVFAIEYRKVG